MLLPSPRVMRTRKPASVVCTFGSRIWDESIERLLPSADCLELRHIGAVGEAVCDRDVPCRLFLDRRIEELVASDRAARAPTLPVRRSHAAAFAPGDEDEEAVFGLDRAHAAATQRRGASRSSSRTVVVTHSSLAMMEHEIMRSESSSNVTR